MEKRKEYPSVIIVDEDNKPMAYDGQQLNYCTNETWQDEHNPVIVYPLSQAKDIIRQTIINRKALGVDPGNYFTMPISL